MILFFFFNDTATTEIYTLSLHDALPISRRPRLLDQSPLLPTDRRAPFHLQPGGVVAPEHGHPLQRGHDGAGVGRDGDRKSTRLNSSHGYISYAVFCLKKKKIQ